MTCFGHWGVSVHNSSTGLKLLAQLILGCFCSSALLGEHTWISPQEDEGQVEQNQVALVVLVEAIQDQLTA